MEKNGRFRKQVEEWEEKLRLFDPQRGKEFLSYTRGILGFSCSFLEHMALERIKEDQVLEYDYDMGGLKLETRRWIGKERTFTTST